MGGGAWLDLLLLALGAMAVLLGLTVLGLLLRARSPSGHISPTLDLYMTRVNSWWAMVILFTLALMLGRWAVVLLFAVAGFAALREFYTYSDHAPADHWALAAAFYLVLPLQFLFVALDWQRAFAVFIPVYVFLLLPVLAALRGDAQRFLARVSGTQWGLMICAFCLSHIPALIWLGDASARAGVLLIAFLIIVVQSADLVDYFVGRYRGQRRIVKPLSPKTWEGAGAGLLAAALLGAALSWLTPFGVAGAALMAVIAAAVGQCGALVLSAIRREKGVRDWSHLIPGQGGVLNQLDSAIFAAPVFFHLTRLWWGG